jgi:hypothetical protein
MDKDLILHGNAARTGGKSKQINSANKTNSAVREKGVPFDEEFAKREVDNQRL